MKMFRPDRSQIAGWLLVLATVTAFAVGGLVWAVAVFFGGALLAAWLLLRLPETARKG